MSRLSEELIERLTEVQNRIAIVYGVPVDIMSYCLGMMDQEQAEIHVARYEEQYPSKD